MQTTDPELFYSQRFIISLNYVVTRRRQGMRTTGQCSDLRGRTVCTCQNASENLGTEFVEASREP